MSFGSKGQAAPSIEPRESQPLNLSHPTYAELQQAERNYMVTNCYICSKDHQINTRCPTKPPKPPSYYYRERCIICYGFHPKNHCYFEYLRENLSTPSYCSNCSVTHIGFCTEQVYCRYCDQCHNFADGCVQQVSMDLSNNLCPTCGLFHTLHCPEELKKITCDEVLYCNRCKIRHQYFKCVPFCNKCFRRHQEGPCPEEKTYCRDCDYCHQNEECPLDLDV